MERVEAEPWAARAAEVLDRPALGALRRLHRQTVEPIELERRASGGCPP